MIALIALLLQAAAPAPETVWERVGTESGLTGYYEPASVVVLDSNRRRVRVRADFAEVREDGVIAGVALVEVDCAGRSGTLLEIQGLDARGNVVTTETIPLDRRRASPNPPGGLEDTVNSRICGASFR